MIRLNRALAADVDERCNRSSPSVPFVAGGSDDPRTKQDLAKQWQRGLNSFP
jgi:hypothetical protein